MTDFMKLPPHKPGYCWRNVAPLGEKPDWQETVAPWTLQTDKLFGHEPAALLAKQYR